MISAALKNDRGSIAPLVLMGFRMMALLVGLVVDASGQISARQHAYMVAAEAARAGGQQIDVNAAAEGEPLTVDSGAAVAAASDYLAAAGVAGSASIVDGGTALAVTTTATYEPRFLGSIGLGPLTVEGHASTRLVRVQQGSEN